MRRILYDARYMPVDTLIAMHEKPRERFGDEPILEAQDDLELALETEE